MRAGLLRDKISFLELTEIRTESGFKKKEYTNVLTTRCSRRKLSAQYGDGLNANEEFIANTVVVQVRFNRLIKEKQRVDYNSKKWNIILIDKQADNSLMITLSKINE